MPHRRDAEERALLAGAQCTQNRPLMQARLRLLPPHFNLPRWFALVAMIAIASISTLAAALLSAFITERMVLQEARLTAEYVQSLVRVEKSLQAFFTDPARGIDAETEQAFLHVAALPDVLRTNVYGRQGKIIWSSDSQMIGRAFGSNRELDLALAGEVVAKKADETEHEEHAKAEHQELRHPQTMFVEIYVPVRNERGDKVLTVLELYKNPKELASALRQMRWWIAAGAAISGALLFAALFGLVRRAAQTIRTQQRQLVESETLAAIGEMSSAVAHGIRNPLASIRSSAELVQEDPAHASQAAGDIVAQSDRLEAWVNQLLSYTRPLEEASAAVALPPLVTQCLADFERDMERKRIRGRAELAGNLPAVHGDALLLGQVLRSVLANAIEAMDHDGQIVVRGESRGGRDGVTLSIEDSGPGMTAAQLARVGKPFFTTKPRGLGIGLALARRVVERFGGRIEIDSRAGAGTVVRLHLKAA
jgi:two-component system, NtrC family, sensor histidine kinase HydH